MNPPINLVLHIRAQVDVEQDHYQIEVLQSPIANWGGPMYQPFNLSLAQQAFDHYQSYLTEQDLATNSLAMRIAQDLGQQLYQILPETTQTLLTKCLGLAKQQGTHLQLVLQFAWNAQHLLQLPWELLCLPNHQLFIAQQHSLVRQLAWHSAQPLVPLQPNEMLGIWAAPHDQEPLSERSQYTPSPTAADGMVWVHGANTRQAAATQLATGLYRGIHLVAHGVPAQGTAPFYLALVDANQQTDRCTAADFVLWLANFPMVACVYLEVCAAGTQHVNWFEQSLTSGLLETSVRSVYAFRTEVTQRDAGTFTQAMYRAWQAGQPLEQAVAAGRRAMRLHTGNALTWSLPVVYHTPTPIQPAVSHVTRAANWFSDRTSQILSKHNLLWVVSLWLLGSAAYVLARFDHQYTLEAALKCYAFFVAMVGFCTLMPMWLHHRSAGLKVSAKAWWCEYVNWGAFITSGTIMLNLLVVLFTLWCWQSFDVLPVRFVCYWVAFGVAFFMSYTYSVQRRRQIKLFTSDFTKAEPVRWRDAWIGIGAVFMFPLLIVSSWYLETWFIGSLLGIWE